MAAIAHFFLIISLIMMIEEESDQLHGQQKAL